MMKLSELKKAIADMNDAVSILEEKAGADGIAFADVRIADGEVTIGCTFSTEEALMQATGLPSISRKDWLPAVVGKAALECKVAAGLPDLNEKFSFQWEREVMKGHKMPKHLPLADQMAFTAMSNIYAAYNSKRLSKDDAAEEKRKVRASYERMKGIAEFGDKLCKTHNRWMIDTSHAQALCRDDPSPENVKHLCNVLHGLRDSFYSEVSLNPASDQGWCSACHTETNK